MSESDPHATCGGRCANGIDFPFVMAFQPIVDIHQRRIHAYEALVRGPKGESAASVLAQVTPDTLYAFDQACRVKAIETAAGLGLDRNLNINFLPQAVYHPEACLRLTLEAARRHGLASDLITFEFTENERVSDRDHLKAIIATYRRHGFQTALDDFGAGYSGLSLLADFQPDKIKIDRSLIDGIDASPARRAIIAGLMQTVGLLDMAVVAEGVERPEELAVLQDFGITLFQGFLFARPVIGRLIGDDDICWQ